MKKEYIDKLKLIKQDSKALNGQKWYLLQATRAVNQAVGKIVSHKNDFGSMIFLDERYLNDQQKHQFSQWFKHGIKTFDDILKSKPMHLEFYQTMKEKNFTPNLKRYDQVQLKYAHLDENCNLLEIQNSVTKAGELYDMKFGYLKQTNELPLKYTKPTVDKIPDVRK